MVAAEVKPNEWIRQYDAALEYYLGVDPDTLTDEQWAIKVENLKWIREQEAKGNE